MRKLWLVFAQAVTRHAGGALRREPGEARLARLARPGRGGPRGARAGASRCPPARRAAPLFLQRGGAQGDPVGGEHLGHAPGAAARNPLLEDPAFQRFFGERFQLPAETQLSLGSGVIVSREGYILTNDHVVEGVTDIQVTLQRRPHAGGQGGRAPIPRPTSRWCAIAAREPHAVTFGQSDQARVGDVVLAIGDPFSVGQTVTMGIVSAVGREIGTANPFGSFIQTDAAINPGNSGGALVDTDGNLIGINTLIFSRSGGSRASASRFPVSLAKRVMEQIIETGTVTRGWFGVDVADITPELAESLGLKGTRGAIVGAIERGSPAEKSGIKLGDVIIEVERQARSPTRAAALNAIAEMPAGKSVPVKVVRRNAGAVARRAGRQAPAAPARRGVARYSAAASPSAAARGLAALLDRPARTKMPTS